MNLEYFKNLLRGYRVFLAMLQAESQDNLCPKCIGLDGALTKAKKGLRKLKVDLQDLAAPKQEKDSLVREIDELAQQAGRLPEAEEPTCMKTAGFCKIGPDCFPLDGALAMMKQIAT